MINFIREIAKLIEEPSLLRPPGALEEKEFLKKCIKCNKCVQICPYYSIVPGGISDGRNMGTPMINARKIPCYLCMKCPPVCPTGALDNSLVKKENVRMGKAVINRDTCLPYVGIICRACFEKCPIFREAIILKDEMYPEVVEEKCVGCGICEHVCPVNNAAIVVKSSNEISQI